MKPLDADKETTTIHLDDAVTYQEMDGFGASFTDSSAYLINQILNEEQRDEVMTRAVPSGERDRAISHP